LAVFITAKHFVIQAITNALCCDGAWLRHLQVMIIYTYQIKEQVLNMKALNKKLLALGLLTSMMIGCASTDPYTPQSDDDFVYDSDMSFAINVVDGSLGLHNGLRDAYAPKNGDVTPGSLDYAADGIIGAALGGGIGGGLLSILGANQGNKPLNSYYGIVYYPVNQKGNIQGVFDKIENELIETAQSTRKLSFVTKSIDANGVIDLTFKGDDCEIAQSLMGFKVKDTCSFIHYTQPKLLKYSTNTPSGEQGLFAVIGYETFYTATWLSLDLDKKYYVFSPVIRNRTQFPFVSNNQHIYLFLKGKGNSSISIDKLTEIDPWVSKHYGAVQ
jgi:hypothetical protein